MSFWKTATEKEKAQISFPHFFFGIFSLGVKRGDGIFVPGAHIKEWCLRLQKHKKTATVSAREHIKTTVALGKIAWHLYRTHLEGRYNENLYMGYVQGLAEHHLTTLKRYLGELPEFFGEFDNLTTAESILHYKHLGSEFICKPTGIQKFKRGLHPKRMICDDILRDPEVKLDISQLLKISKIFREQIISMPKEELHVLGTPQDEQDLFAELEKLPGWNCRRYPAIINEAKHTVLWPEFWGWDKLQERKGEIREKAFNKEFQCRPVRSEEGYFTSLEVDSVIEDRYKNYGFTRQPKINGFCYGGYDIGKKRHPSHISLFAQNRHGRFIQIASIWLDNQDYTVQLKIMQQLCEYYNVQEIYYDNTRAEMEGFAERGELPAVMTPLTFTQKEKFDMAAQLEKAIKKKSIVFLQDERQRRQILNCDNDLKSMASDEGHGDSFWSNCMAVKAMFGAMANIILV